MTADLCPISEAESVGERGGFGPGPLAVGAVSSAGQELGVEPIHTKTSQ